MTKKLLSTTSFLLIILLCTLPITAHSGRTDSSGGHYDRSTGEYHYHHGYPAHDHYGGDCPYSFHNNEKHSTSSGLSSTDDYTTNDTKTNDAKTKKQFNVLGCIGAIFLLIACFSPGFFCCIIIYPVIALINIGKKIIYKLQLFYNRKKYLSLIECQKQLDLDGAEQKFARGEMSFVHYRATISVNNQYLEKIKLIKKRIDYLESRYKDD